MIKDPIADFLIDVIPVGNARLNVSVVHRVRPASALARNVYIGKSREKFWSLKSELKSTRHLLKPMLMFNSYVRNLEARLKQVESDLIKQGASNILNPPSDGSAAVEKSDDVSQDFTTLSPTLSPAFLGENQWSSHAFEVPLFEPVQETLWDSHNFETPLVDPFEKISLSESKGPEQMSTDSGTAAVTLNAAGTTEDISNIPVDATEIVHDQTYRGEQSSFKSVYQSLRNRCAAYFRPSVQAGYRRLEWTCVSIRPINTLVVS